MRVDVYDSTRPYRDSDFRDVVAGNLAEILEHVHEQSGFHIADSFQVGGRVSVPKAARQRCQLLDDVVRGGADLQANMQGRTLVHFSAQRQCFQWDKGCLRVFMAGMEVVFRLLVQGFTVRSGSG
jgi:hypothetical protein